MELKKTKTFKRNLVIMLLMIMSLLLVGCNETVANENSVTLTLTESYQSYIDYEEIPSFTLEFDGSLNTISTVTKSYYTVFSGNEDIILSNALTELFAKYGDKVIYEIVNEDEVETRYFSTIENGKVKNTSMKCDDNKVYDEIAYIPLDNGLKLTIDYCRFNSDGVTYYTWRYSQSIAMYLYYPIMKIKNNDKVELVLLTVPNVISIHISPELKLANIINKDEYLESSYYSFSYYGEDTEELSVKKAYVWDYYEDYNISARTDEFTFVYLNNNFKCNLYDTGFTITWLSRI